MLVIQILLQWLQKLAIHSVQLVATYEVSVSKNAVKDATKEAVKVTSVSPAITVTADTSVAHETTYKVGFDGNRR